MLVKNLRGKPYYKFATQQKRSVRLTIVAPNCHWPQVLPHNLPQGARHNHYQVLCHDPCYSGLNLNWRDRAIFYLVLCELFVSGAILLFRVNSA